MGQLSAISIIISVFVSVFVLHHLYRQIGATARKPQDLRADLYAYTPVIRPCIVWSMLAVYLFWALFVRLAGLFTSGYNIPVHEYLLSLTGGVLFTVVLISTVYYTLLFCFLPLLKKKLRPATCVALWGLPNILYFTAIIIQLKHRVIIGTGQWVLLLKGDMVTYLYILWMSGFLLVLSYTFLSHILFRRRLLAKSRVWENEEAQNKWRSLIT